MASRTPPRREVWGSKDSAQPSCWHSRALRGRLAGGGPTLLSAPHPLVSCGQWLLLHHFIHHSPTLSNEEKKIQHTAKGAGVSGASFKVKELVQRLAWGAAQLPHAPLVSRVCTVQRICLLVFRGGREGREPNLSAPSCPGHPTCPTHCDFPGKRTYQGAQLVVSVAPS